MGVGKAVRVVARTSRRVSHTAPAVHTVTHTVSGVSHLPSAVGLVSSSVAPVSAAASSTSATAAAAAARQAAVAKARQHRAKRQSKQIDKHRKDLQRNDVSKIRQKFAKGKRALPGLDTGQTKVAAKVLKTGVKSGASKKELLAATETGIVESGLRNLKYGDADSEGFRQERTSIYGPKHATSVKLSAQDFFSETAGASKSGTAGQLAQAVQRSAFPERYDQVKSQAKPIVKAYLHGKAPAKLKQLPGPWSGSRSAVAKGLKGVSGFKGGKRTPAENASVGGSPTSDHLTSNKAAYAKDIPATGSQGTAIAHKVASNLGIKNLQTGTYNWYTSPKAPGYRFQILWQVEGHFDHVHVGAEYVGAGASSTSVPGGAGVATATAGRGAVSPSAATAGTSVGKATSQTEAARTKAKTSSAKKQGKLISSYISKPGQPAASTTVPLVSARNFAGKTAVRRRTSLGL
jgi:hypothetical protein